MKRILPVHPFLLMIAAVYQILGPRTARMLLRRYGCFVKGEDRWGVSPSKMVRQRIGDADRVLREKFEIRNRAAGMKKRRMEEST